MKTHYDVFEHVLCRSKPSVSPFLDMGGNYISVPVMWFNNVVVWKDTFAHPKRTFVVTMVEFSNPDTCRHEMYIMGASSEDNFVIDQNAYTKFRKYWTDHGERLVPCYILKATTTEAYETLPATPKKPKRGGMLLCTIVCTDKIDLLTELHITRYDQKHTNKRLTEKQNS